MSSASATGSELERDLRALRAEQEMLLTENLEYMGVLSRYARALGLCATLAPEPLAERIVEGLCLETRAQGGLLWIASEEDGKDLGLLAARGVVKAHDEPETLSVEEPPPGLEPLGEPGSGAFVGPLGPGADGGEALWMRLRHGGRLIAAVRVSDRLDAASFDARDLAAAEQFAEVAALALANALRFRSLERRSLRDPRTHAYTKAFFDGVVANELEKAHRFGRHFSLLEIELGEIEALRGRAGDGAAAAAVDRFAGELQAALRGTDLCASDGEGRYRLLLAETDAVGAAVLKRRLRGLVGPAGPDALSLRLAAATYPSDGTSLADLQRALLRRLEQESRSLARMLELECGSFAESARRLLRDAGPVPPRLPEQALRFVLEELRRRTHERGLLWLAPGAELHAAAFDELSRLRGRPLRTEITLVADDDAHALLGIPVSNVPAHRVGTRAPFLVYLGEASTYACLRAREGDGAPFFHTADRVLVEHLAFQLQRDLGRTGVS